MSLIDDVGLGSATKRTVKQPDYVTNDFPGGFIILEYKDGKPQPADQVVLTGPFMPHQPFSFGGEQRLVTEWYPGNSEPSVQVLGPKEKPLTIKGEIKLKRFKRSLTESPTGPLEANKTRQTAQEFQELIDDIRLRGNPVYIAMGEWHRWGFIESVNFDLHVVTRISYTITFLITGFNQPKNCKILDQKDDNIIKPNKDLTNAALKSISEMQTMPTTMPQTLAEFLNGEIGKVASAIKLVTNFTDDILTSAEQLNASVNRALGLIKNARATISSSIRRVNQLTQSVSSLGSSFANEWEQTKALIKNATHIHKIRSDYSDLASLLAALQAKYAALRTNVPAFRHLVRQGDTLQKISMKYYNTADNWEKIYKHNKLSSTDLVVGSVVEIPKI